MSRLAVRVKEVDIDFEVFTDRRASLKARLLDRNELRLLRLVGLAFRWSADDLYVDRLRDWAKALRSKRKY